MAVSFARTIKLLHRLHITHLHLYQVCQEPLCAKFINKHEMMRLCLGVGVGN